MECFLGSRSREKAWDSSLDIQMTGLESTEELPLNIELRDQWASLRKHPAMD